MNMYAAGDYVVRANVGICQISDIGYPDFQTVKERQLFYTLLPVGDSRTKLYIPVAPEPVGVREVMNRNEALELIRQMPDIQPIIIENEKLREQQYRQALRSNDPRQLAAVIKVLYLRDKARTAQGKKSVSVDSQYFQKAEKLLYSELAMALAVEVSEIPAYLQSAISE